MDRAWDSASFSIEEVDANIHRLGVRGELDAASVDAFRGHARSVLQRSHNLIVDFGELTYFDSVGLSAVIEIWQLASRGPGGLAVIVDDKLRRRFDMRGVGAMLPFATDEADALSLLHRGAQPEA